MRRKHCRYRYDTGQRGNRGLASLAQRLGFAPAPGIDFNRETDIAVTQYQSLDDILLHDAAPADRIDDLVERLEHLVAVRMSHVRLVTL
jgi:hypothetical protein